jgi:hypothetical protein
MLGRVGRMNNLETWIAQNILFWVKQKDKTEIYLLYSETSIHRSRYVFPHQSLKNHGPDATFSRIDSFFF